MPEFQKDVAMAMATNPISGFIDPLRDSIEPEKAGSHHDDILGDFYDAPYPKRTLKHKLLNSWNKFKGCACAGMATQAGIHSICVVFAATSGVGGGIVSSTLAPLVNGRGLMGLTAPESLQYLAAPILSVPISYGIDRWRAARYSLSKAAVAFAMAAGTTVAISAIFPHQHDAEMANLWFQKQTPEAQERIRDLARSTNQSVSETAILICGQRPDHPAYKRVLQYFQNALEIQ